ncbi:MAG: F0F1 ATP synthase subunit alpha [Thermohalobaculum sp.]|nr:F0F1 ATP synthase subunit alpha [Thermohalobaculum sp.]
MADRIAAIAGAFGAALGAARLDALPPVVREVGTVVGIGDGVAHVEGLRGVASDELVALPGGLLGIAASLREDRIGLILLGPGDGLTAGAEARRTGRIVDVPVGHAYLGRVVDALGQPLDGGGPVRCRLRQTVERPAPAIIERAPVCVPLQTGIKAIDATIPIGRGQRELILGDRQTGKTSIALDTILNQADSGVVSVYCAIGQRASAVARVIDRLRRHGALARTVVVVASGEDAPGLQFIAPYTATAIAEFFMHRGQDALVVHDDLTRHARAYRELSLLLRRPPGREAFPGDIFYVHARLLERATHLRDAQGGGSLTALPIVETEAGNLAAYIPTNLISITDGQITLSTGLFRKGMLPAIDIGLSVSRVGGDAQLPAYRAVAGALKLAYAQFEELEVFARFGSRLDEDTRRQLERGRRVREVLRQDEHAPVPVLDQLGVLLAATEGLLDDTPVGQVAAAEAAIRARLHADCAGLAAGISAGRPIDDACRGALMAAARAALGTG